MLWFVVEVLLMWLVRPTRGQALGKAYFLVDEGKEKCFVENLPAQTAMSISYTSAENPGVMCSIQVQDPRQRAVANRPVTRDKSSGKLAFLSQMSGHHQVCVKCQSSKWFSNHALKWTMAIDLGDAELSLSSLPKKEDADTIRLTLKNLKDKLAYFKSMDQYGVEQEKAFRQSARWNARLIVACSIAQIMLLTGSTAFAVQHLRKFFKASNLM